jgi:hypothetical protein
VIDDDSDEFGDVERIINVPSAGSVNRGHDQITIPVINKPRKAKKIDITIPPSFR